MTCPSPDVSPYSTQEVLPTNYGFVLDGVQNFTSLKDLAAAKPFQFFPDPVYFKFDDPKNTRKLNSDQTSSILEIQVRCHQPQENVA